MTNQSFQERLQNVNRKDALVGLVILIALALGVYLISKSNPRQINISTPTMKPEERIENKFNRVIPDGIEKTELIDVSGSTGSGIATRSEILVDLPDPEAGKYYQAWLEKDSKVVSLGKLRMAKGGWLIEYNSSSYPGYNKVFVSLETKFDLVLETKVLEGTFK